MNGPDLRLEGVTILRGGRPAVVGLEAHFPPASLIALAGPNGGGKTTLLSALAGILPVAAGRITMGGQPVPLAAGRVGYLPQRHGLDLDFPVPVGSVVAQGRLVRRGLWAGFTSEDQQAVDAALGAMGLEALRNRPLARLSGGQQQRVLIARALATGAEVLLLDEPLAGLDEATAGDLLARLRRWADAGHLVVVALHDRRAITAWCSHVLHLNRLQVASGPVVAAMAGATHG